MDINFECKVSLSKKIRAIIGNGTVRMVLVVDSVQNGKGDASLLISGDELDINASRQNLGKETSIQFTPISLKEEVPSNDAIVNIFATNLPTEHGGLQTPVDNLAAIHPPEKGAASSAIKSSIGDDTPEQFKEYNNPKFRSFVSNIEELMMATKASQGKGSEIDLDAISDPRQRALAIEMKEKAEGIDIPAVVVNDTCGSVRVNDIDLTLMLNSPFNLANISSKRVESSGELKSLLRSNVIKFIDPATVGDYVDKVAKVESTGYETYDLDGAFASFSGQASPARTDSIDIPVADESPSEQEQLAGLINLTPMNVSSEGGVRTSHHGGALPTVSNRSIGSVSSANSKGIKTISHI